MSDFHSFIKKVGVSVRYQAPLLSLWEFWLIKAVLAAMYTLFATQIELVVLLVFALGLDLITGVAAAKRRGEKVRSIGLRRTFVKIVEYSIMLALAISLANVYSFLSWLEVWAFAFITLTEAISILENLARPGSVASEFAGKLRGVMKRFVSKKKEAS